MSQLEYVNNWDDGYASGGNYWSDYNGTDTNYDGIGETPYEVDANNTDRYPLVRPYTPKGPFYIRADGSVEPPSAPILNIENVSYTFTADIYGTIVIERDNIALDGAGHTLEETELESEYP